MKVLFLRFASYFSEENAHPENVMAPLDIAIMASIADQLGHETELVDTEADSYDRETLLRTVGALRPDLVVVKAKSPSRADLQALFSTLRVPTVGFGHAFIADPESFFFDGSSVLCLIDGEPEITFREIIQRLADGGGLDDLAGITTQTEEGVRRHSPRGLLEDLDELPLPKHEWFLDGRYYSFYPIPLFHKRKMGFMLSSRGCPMKCIFCSATLRQTYGAGMRYHSIDRVVEEMASLRRRGVKFIQFRDDIFTVSRKRVLELSDRIIREGLDVNWMAQTHVTCLDGALLRKMKEAGCVTLGVGFESGSPRVLRTLNKRYDLDHAREVAKQMKSLGIRMVGFFLIGNPGETREEIERTGDFILELDPDLIQIALFTPYAGSWAYEYLLPEEQKGGGDGSHHYNALSHNFSEVPTEELLELHRRLYLRYIARPRNLARFAVETGVGLAVNPHTASRLLSGAYRFLVKRYLRRATT